MKLTLTHKIFILLFCFVCTLYGFLIKLPTAFRANDKLWHSIFYFCAAVFISLLFPKRQIIILILLAGFGIGIEYLQEYSNTYTKKRIHGRFDIEDVKANLKGLGAYAIFSMVFFLGKTIFKKPMTVV